MKRFVGVLALAIAIVGYGWGIVSAMQNLDEQAATEATAALPLPAIVHCNQLDNEDNRDIVEWCEEEDEERAPQVLPIHGQPASAPSLPAYCHQGIVCTPEGAYYVVKPGDTYWQIAQGLRGDGAKWHQLCPRPPAPPNELPVGTKVWLC